MKLNCKSALVLAACLAAPLAQAQVGSNAPSGGSIPISTSLPIGNGQIQNALKALGTRIDANSTTMKGCVTRAGAAQSGAPTTIVSIQGVATSQSDSAGCFTGTVSNKLYSAFFDAFSLTSAVTDRGSTVQICFTVGGAIPTDKIRVAFMTMPGGVPTVAFYNTNVTTGCLKTGAFNGPYSLNAMYVQVPTTVPTSP